MKEPNKVSLFNWSASSSLASLRWLCTVLLVPALLLLQGYSFSDDIGGCLRLLWLLPYVVEAELLPLRQAVHCILNPSFVFLGLNLASLATLERKAQRAKAGCFCRVVDRIMKPGGQSGKNILQLKYFTNYVLSFPLKLDGTHAHPAHPLPMALFLCLRIDS